jgi:uncharacterized membrane protein YfcA
MPPFVGVPRLVSASAIGFIAGGTLGLVGWGGGQIIIPSLTSPWIGLSQIAATGTSLTSLSFAATVAASKFLWHDQAHLYTAVCISIPSIVAARFGARLAGKLNGEVHALIFNGLSLLLLPTHFYVQQRRQQLKDVPQNTQTGPDTRAPSQAWKLQIVQHACFGSVCGLISALMGVGGLPLTMSYLTIFVPELPHHIVQGTAMVSAVPSVLTSAYVQAKAGHTPISLAAAVGFGSMMGSAAGAHIALSLSEEQLRYAFMASLVLLGGRSAVAAAFNIRRILLARHAAAGTVAKGL